MHRDRLHRLKTKQHSHHWLTSKVIFTFLFPTSSHLNVAHLFSIIVPKNITLRRYLSITFQQSLKHPTYLHKQPIVNTFYEVQRISQQILSSCIVNFYEANLNVSTYVFEMAPILHTSLLKLFQSTVCFLRLLYAPSSIDCIIFPLPNVRRSIATQTPFTNFLHDKRNWHRYRNSFDLQNPCIFRGSCSKFKNGTLFITHQAVPKESR